MAKPKTAYEYRRVILFAQVMSIKDAIKRYKAMKYLAQEWGVDGMPLSTALAQHALEYERNNDNG